MFTDCPRINVKYDDWNLIKVIRRLGADPPPYIMVHYLVKEDVGLILRVMSFVKTNDSYMKQLKEFSMLCENFVRYL